MFRSRLALVLAVVCLCKVGDGSVESTYSAVVVEYSPSIDSSLDPDTNILNNVNRYVEFINAANNHWQADIIVFPEYGLIGYSNQKLYLEVPDHADKVLPCAHNTTYEAPIVQLSCAARATATYVVVNLLEKFYNSSLQRTQHFNTDVVFDMYGVIVARYRKINLFGDQVDRPAHELVYFETEFGVRFGLFTCFDIIFKDPGLDLANNYNVSHFIFPTAWFSEMPFLTAIQEQWYWSYTQDAVLLASGYNFPPAGSSGSGIYLGRKGPLIYKMTQVIGSFMLQADVPKRFSSGTNTLGSKTRDNTGLLRVEKEILKYTEKSSLLLSSSDQLKMTRDFLDVYSTELISVPWKVDEFKGTQCEIPFTVKTSVCQNTICCDFSLEILSTFSRTQQNITRGDDYSQLHYRLVVFDGVKNYHNFATGGIQTCGIIPCVNKDLRSCGLRSDDSSAQPNMILDFFQTGFTFKSITITGTFSNNNSFVGPNILLGGEDENFGALSPSGNLVFINSNVTNISTINTFETTKPMRNLVTASLYGRIFYRDGEQYTGSTAENSSCYGIDFYTNVVLFVTAIAMLKYSLQ